MLIYHHIHLGFDNKTGYSLGTEGLLKRMDVQGVDKAVVFSCPNVPPLDKNPYERENERVLTESFGEPKLIPFMFVHPYLDTPEYVNATKDHFKGFKIYSSARGIEYSYSKIQNTEVFDVIRSTGKPLLVHTSLREGGRARDLVEVIRRYSGPVILAHLARLSSLDLDLVSGLKNSYLDLAPLNVLLNNPQFLANTSELPEAIRDLSPEKIVNYLKGRFTGRLIWGTDSPWCDHLSPDGYRGEVNLFKRLGLGEVCINLVE
jgi:hypothetical protein